MSFDDFLAEEEILQEVEAVAIKRILARQVSEAMRPQRLTKKAMAARMGTSRSALAAKTLKDMGIGNVTNLLGGFTAWQQGGGKIER